MVTYDHEPNRVGGGGTYGSCDGSCWHWRFWDRAATPSPRTWASAPTLRAARRIEAEGEEEEEEPGLLDLIREYRDEWNKTKELFKECVAAFEAGKTVEHFAEKGLCSLSEEEHLERFSHFVDDTWREDDADETPKFTSVQDFYIERPDLEPQEVLDLFKQDWDPWWDSLGTDQETMGWAVDWEDALDGHEACDREPMPDDCQWHQEIGPIKLKAVNIFMSVDDAPLLDPSDPSKGVSHPPLRNEENDFTEGYKKHWDAGLKIRMGDEGNAFVGTMVVLARKNEELGRIEMREIWYETEPVSFLVMKVVPFFIDMSDETLLSIPPLLHLLATEGCVPGIAPNSGYTGLFQRLENGELLP